MKYIPLFLLLVIPFQVSAESPSLVLDFVCDQVLFFWGWLRGAVYVLGGIGLALMAFKAFLGKFEFGNFISWGGALFLLSMVQPLIFFLTSGGGTLGCAAWFSP